MRLIVSLNDGPARPSILLQASATTRSGTMKDFLTRVKTFPHVKYFIVGVNLLLSEARSVLIKWISNSFYCYFIYLSVIILIYLIYILPRLLLVDFI